MNPPVMKLRKGDQGVLDTQDRDGTPFFFAVPGFAFRSGEKLRQALMGVVRLHAKMWFEAERLDCQMREIPMLGMTEPGPFHPSFKVERDEGGRVIKITRERPVPVVHAEAPGNSPGHPGFIRTRTACGDVVMGRQVGGSVIPYEDRARATCAECRES